MRQDRRVPPGHPVRGTTLLIIVDQVNAYQSRLLEGIRSVLDPAKIPQIVYISDPFARRLRTPARQLLLAGDVRAAITTILADPDNHRNMLAAVAAAHIPSVHVGSPLARRTSVGGDNVTGMRALMAHLIDQAGASHIALVRGPDHHPDSYEREQVVRQEVAVRGLELAESMVIDGRFDRDSAYTAMARLLRSSPELDAVVALNDRSAMGVLDALADAGLRVPNDVLVSGFDDDTIAQETTLGLTTVSQDLYQQGVRAAQLLLTQLDGSPSSGHEQQASRLVVRQSTTRNAVSASSHRPRLVNPDQADLAAAMERGLALNRSFMTARSIPQLLRTLADNISRLSLHRAFIVLNLEPTVGQPAQGAAVFGHLHGHTRIPRHPAPFALREVLPGRLRGLLTTGVWNLQPLSLKGTDLGYVLFEQAVPDQFVGELLRMDLSRALDSLTRTARHAAALAANAQRLEELVGTRTAELRAEVANRTTAELELRQANHELRKLSRLDLLTGVANRARFDEYLAEQWEAHTRTGGSLSLLLVDVDNFKQHNDNYGHVYGDMVLRQVGACLSSALWSPRDLGARYGGDEFAAVLPKTDLAGTRTVAQRVYDAVAALAAQAVRRPPTVSIGTATLTPIPGQTPTALVAAADKALYRAKLSGRNQIAT